MKIPYHSSKIKLDFETYINEFQASFCQNIEEHQAKSRNDLFKTAYPLFVLLESLSDSEYSTNPSIELILQEAFIENNHDIINKLSHNLSTNKNHSKDEQRLLQIALKRTQFTPYFYELYSDVLLLLNAYYMNNYRGAHIALRTILEDVYRHLYYKDHREEFYAIQNPDCDEHNFGLSPLKFREYLPQTSFLNPLNKLSRNFETVTDNKGDSVFGWNTSLYSKTSAYVHASKLDFMGNFKKNSDMAFNEESSKNLCDIAKEVITLSVVFLICAHRTELLRLSDYAKSLILCVFSDKKTRHNFRKQLNI